MVVSKRDSLRWVLRIGDVKLEQVEKLNSLGSVLTDNGRNDTEI